MDIKKALKSSKLAVFNVALLSIMIGFVIGIVSFSCSTGSKESNLVYAQDLKETEAIESLSNLQNGFRYVAKKVTPAVVRIDVVDIVKQERPDFSSPFKFFFGPQNGEEGEKDAREYKRPGLGSGVIVKRNGKKVYVLTNNHVVGTADEIQLTLPDHREFEATLVGTDERKDLALVVFETTEEVPIADLADSDEVQVGDWALAIGSPMGLESTVTAGIISAIGREEGPEGNISDFLQTDAAINPGNSGGALVNIRGEVIGINTWIASSTGTFTGYGFAIPINNAKKTIDDFIKFGKVEYGWLGVQITDADNDLRKELGIVSSSGAIVSQLYKGSPADKGGILPGDYIIKINGTTVKNKNHLTVMVGDLPAGPKHEFTIDRQGEIVTLNFSLAIRKEEADIKKDNNNVWPGMSVLTITEKVKEYFDVEKAKGVGVYRVWEDTPAGIAGFREGDIIVKINGTSINTLKDYYKAINDSKSKEIMVQFERKGVELKIGIVK